MDLPYFDRLDAAQSIALTRSPGTPSNQEDRRGWDALHERFMARYVPMLRVWGLQLRRRKRAG